MSIKERTIQMKHKNYSRTVVMTVADNTVHLSFYNWLSGRNTKENLAKTLRVSPTVSSLERFNRIISKSKVDNIKLDIELPAVYTTFSFYGDYYA
jgi:hypothetical protein